MMVRFKSILLASLFLFSSVSNSQTMVFDLGGNNSMRKVAPVQSNIYGSEDEDENQDVRLQGVRQEDGSVVFHQLENEDDLLFVKEEDGSIVDQWGNVIEAAPEIPLNPFYRAVVTQNVAQLQLMLAAGENVNQLFDDGNTALHLAAYYKNKDMVELLLWYNASLTVRNTEKSTALHLLCAYGTKESLELVKVRLKDKFVDSLNKEGSYKRNCFHYAMLNSSNDLVINYLLNSGMNLTHLSEEGQTPTHYAAMYGLWNNVRLAAEHNIELIKIKGDKSMKDRSVEDLMFTRMDIFNQLSFLKYFNEENQELLNVKFNKANI